MGTVYRFETEVRADGGGTRVFTQEETGWGQSPRTFEVSRQAFRRPRLLRPDFSKQGKNPNLRARNFIRLERVRLPFLRLFIYQESFRDAATRAGVKRVYRRYFPVALRTFADHLHPAVSSKISKAKLRRLLSDRYRPIFDRWVRELLARNYAYFDSEEFQNSERDLEPEAAASWLLRELGMKEGSKEGAALEGALTTAFTDASKKTEEELDLIETGAFEPVFGLFGLTIFESHDFSVTVRLPGEVIRTNADQRAGGVLSWTFKGQDLHLKEKRLYAVSRLIYPSDGLPLAVASALLILILSAYRFIKRV